MKKRNKKIIWRISWVLFLLYLAVLAYLLFFAEMYGRTSEGAYSYNTRPFREIGRYLKYREQIGTFSVLANLLGNIIGFVPFGFVFPIIAPRCKNIFLITIFSFDVSLLIETMQLIFQVGSFDVDDMILNTFGGFLGCVGFFVCDAIRKKIRRRKKKSS